MCVVLSVGRRLIDTPSRTYLLTVEFAYNQNRAPHELQLPKL